MAITLPFDIRDVEIDHADGVKTIATYLGKDKTILLSLGFSYTLPVLPFLLPVFQQYQIGKYHL
ncbi:MAG: hypothetical protein IPN72_05125 [Saprospiraceae bacterium]|nr:hypothetical protein [Saprospiraceae bacterium]